MLIKITINLCRKNKLKNHLRCEELKVITEIINPTTNNKTIAFTLINSMIINTTSPNTLKKGIANQIDIIRTITMFRRNMNSSIMIMIINLKSTILMKIMKMIMIINMTVIKIIVSNGNRVDVFKHY